MNTRNTDIVKRILHRLEDAKMEIRSLALSEEYPLSAKFTRAIDSLENAAKFLGETISEEEE